MRHLYPSCFFFLARVIPQNGYKWHHSISLSACSCVCAYTPLSHDPSQSKWLFFSIPPALLIPLPPCHPFGFAQHCMTYLNSRPGWISRGPCSRPASDTSGALCSLFQEHGPFPFFFSQTGHRWANNRQINSENRTKSKLDQRQW